jgi:hypothetical protein
MMLSVAAWTRCVVRAAGRDLCCAAIAILAFAGAGGAPPALTGQPPTVRRDSTPRDSLGFQHARHAKLPCTDCHGTSAKRGSVNIRGPESCRSCHHRVDQAEPCTTCHANAIKVTRQAIVTFKVVARRGPAVTRDLSFRHEQHGRLDCVKCHGTGTDHAVGLTCTSCHSDHHAAERTCATCHAGARAGHDRAAHDGCTRCHVNASLPSVAASRTLCLTCHEAQRDHQTGGSCAACHAVAPDQGTAGARRP